MPRIDIEAFGLAPGEGGALQIFTDPDQPGIVFVGVHSPAGDAVVVALSRRTAMRAGLDIQEAAHGGMVPPASCLVH